MITHFAMKVEDKELRKWLRSDYISYAAIREINHKEIYILFSDSPEGIYKDIYKDDYVITCFTITTHGDNIINPNSILKI
jgi:hypothetical protein